MDLYLSGDMSRAEWMQIRDDIQRQQQAQQPIHIDVMPAAERLRSIGELWPHWEEDERRDALTLLFQSIDLDIKEKEMYVRPWPEFTGMFSHRHEWWQSTPGRNRTLPTYPGRFWVKGLIA